MENPFDGDRSGSMELSHHEFNNVKQSWLTYVQSEREKQGKDTYARLESSHCCGKSQTSYPHYPR